MKVFCLDTETTAGMRTGRVVQYAIVSDDYEWERLVKPPTRISPATIKVHRITPAMVKDKPKFNDTQWYPELIQRLEAWEYLIAHHARFDMNILANEWVQVPNYICSCKVARAILKQDWVPRFGLQFLKDYLGLEEKYATEELEGYAHSALYDTKVLYRLYKYLYSKIEILYPNRDPHEVMREITYDFKPLTRLSFGKYKWKTIKSIWEIDKSYLLRLYCSEKKNSIPRQALLKWIEILFR